MAEKFGFLQAAKAVAWSFFGIRRRAAHEQDLSRLRPFQVIVAGLAGAALFVLALIALVEFIVHHAT